MSFLSRLLVKYHTHLFLSKIGDHPLFHYIKFAIAEEHAEMELDHFSPKLANDVIAQVLATDYYSNF